MKFRRTLNLVRRMMNGDEFYTNDSPRITYEEIRELRIIGLDLQVEHTCGAMPGQIAVYPLDKEKFASRAREILPSLEHHAKHGDMDGHTCLLAECPLHYPKTFNAS